MDAYDSSMFAIYLAVLIFFWIGLSDFIRISYINKDPEAHLKEKQLKIPRITLSCIACMFLYLLTAALRLFLFYDSLRYGGQIFAFIGMFTVICILSGLNLIAVRTLCNIGMIRQVKNSWIALKLTFIPFLPLNIWLFDKTLDYIDPEIIASAIILIIFIPIFLFLIFLIAIIFPFAINATNGCIGIIYIRHISKQAEKSKQPSVVHFVLQMFPGTDLISMLFILIKYKKSRLGTKAAETDHVTVQSAYAVPSPYADRSPSAALSSYADRSLCTDKTTPATKPKIHKKKHRWFLFLLYLSCGILFYFSSEIMESTGEVYEEVTAEETTFYEMTDEETSLIQDCYWDNEIKEKIADGQLTAHQAELLENLRIGYGYIENKYPDGQLRVEKLYHKYDDDYYSNHTTDSPEISYYTLRIVPVQPSDRVYQMEFSTSPDSIVEDNLYAYMQEDSYFRYIEEQITGLIPGFAKVDTDEWYDWYMAEYDDPADLTVEAVLNGEYFAGLRFVDVYIAAGGKTADECEQQEETLSQIFRRIELPVQRYTIRYYDLTVEEILASDFNPDGTIAAFSIHQNLPEDSP